MRRDGIIAESIEAADEEEWGIKDQRPVKGESKYVCINIAVSVACFDNKARLLTVRIVKISTSMLDG
jgi:hypothetical protein